MYCCMLQAKAATQFSIEMQGRTCCAGASGVVTALTILLVLLLATKPFQMMPLNALAAIVIAGVIPLVDFRSFVILVQVF